jgi:uncharacterized phiE125 gp8 family phage protein
MITQGLRLYLDAISEDGVIRIGRGPVQTIENVTVYDESGRAAAISLAGSVLDGNSRPRLMLVQHPQPGRAVNGIEVDFTAGFGDAPTDVPDSLKRAMLTHVALMFSCRGVVEAGDQPALIPPGYDRLVAPYLLRSL